MTRYGVEQEADWNALGDEEFRQQLRSYFEAHYPGHLRDPGRRLFWSEQSSWYLAMVEKGWIAPAWPVEFGGMGLDTGKLLAFLEEQERWGIARYQDHGVRMIGPILIAMGTPEQQERFLPPILSCEARYCQGYSEPDAGSDLASLRTSARPVEGGWVVNGSKIWTTMAHDVTHMFLLARTASDGPSQQALGFFLLDLATAGVLVRPIRDIAGEDELCEVFFDDVFIPDDQLIGDPRGGWTVAKSVLGFERIHVGSPQLPESGLRLLERLVAATSAPGAASPELAREVAELQLDVRHLTAAYHGFAAALEGGEPLGAEVSLLKIWATETFQRAAMTVIEVSGAAGGTRGSVDFGGERLAVLGAYYRAKPSTIYGGSSEVQRNILAKRVLGLPG